MARNLKAYAARVAEMTDSELQTAFDAERPSHIRSRDWAAAGDVILAEQKKRRDVRDMASLEAAAGNLAVIRARFCETGSEIHYAALKVAEAAEAEKIPGGVPAALALAIHAEAVERYGETSATIDSAVRHYVADLAQGYVSAEILARLAPPVRAKVRRAALAARALKTVYRPRKRCVVVIQRGKVVALSPDYDGARAYVTGYARASVRQAAMSAAEVNADLARVFGEVA